MKTNKLIIFVLAALLLLTACTANNPWQDAIYKEDTTLGTGEVTFTLTVEVGENAVDFTVLTNESTLDAALLAVELVEGEDGAFGLYIKKVNGIVADYDIDGSFWSVYIGDTAATTGVSEINVVDGASYKLVYTR